MLKPNSAIAETPIPLIWSTVHGASVAGLLTILLVVKFSNTAPTELSVPITAFPPLMNRSRVIGNPPLDMCREDIRRTMFVAPPGSVNGVNVNRAVPTLSDRVITVAASSGAPIGSSTHSHPAPTFGVQTIVTPLPVGSLCCIGMVCSLQSKGDQRCIRR